jgi:hypothetical protein
MEWIRKKPKVWDNTHQYEGNTITISKRREGLENTYR